MPSDECSVDLAAVEKAAVTTSSGDPFGQATSGVIELIGVLIPATKETTISRYSPESPAEYAFPKTDYDEFSIEADDSVLLDKVYYLPITFGEWLFGLILTSSHNNALGCDEYSRVGSFMFGSETFQSLGIPERPAPDLSNWPPSGLSVQRIRII